MQDVVGRGGVHKSEEVTPENIKNNADTLLMRGVRGMRGQDLTSTTQTHTTLGPWIHLSNPHDICVSNVFTPQTDPLMEKPKSNQTLEKEESKHGKRQAFFKTSNSMCVCRGRRRHQ